VFTIRERLVRFERSSEHGDRRIVRIAGRGDLIAPGLAGRGRGVIVSPTVLDL
jgi:hypothetical protein